MTDGYLSYTEAATYLELSRKTLERAVKDHRIPYRRDPLTGRVRFLKSELDVWINQQPSRSKGGLA